MDYKLVEKFLTRLRVQRFSENTIENYKSQLIYFLKISNQYKPEDITDNQLEKFIIWLVNEKNIGQSYQKAVACFYFATAYFMFSTDKILNTVTRCFVAVKHFVFSVRNI